MDKIIELLTGLVAAINNHAEALKAHASALSNSAAPSVTVTTSSAPAVTETPAAPPAEKKTRKPKETAPVAETPTNAPAPTPAAPVVEAPVTPAVTSEPPVTKEALIKLGGELLNFDGANSTKIQGVAKDLGAPAGSNGAYRISTVPEAKFAEAAARLKALIEEAKKAASSGL